MDTSTAEKDKKQQTTARKKKKVLETKESEK